MFLDEICLGEIVTHFSWCENTLLEPFDIEFLREMSYLSLVRQMAYHIASLQEINLTFIAIAFGPPGVGKR